MAKTRAKRTPSRRRRAVPKTRIERVIARRKADIKKWADIFSKEFGLDRADLISDLHVWLLSNKCPERVTSSYLTRRMKLISIDLYRAKKKRREVPLPEPGHELLQHSCDWEDRYIDRRVLEQEERKAEERKERAINGVRAWYNHWCSMSALYEPDFDRGLPGINQSYPHDAVRVERAIYAMSNKVEEAAKEYGKSEDTIRDDVRIAKLILARDPILREVWRQLDVPRVVRYQGYHVAFMKTPMDKIDRVLAQLLAGKWPVEWGTEDRGEDARHCITERRVALSLSSG